MVGATHNAAANADDLDTFALAEELAGWVRETSETVLRVAGRNQETFALTNAVSRLLGAGDRLRSLRVRRAGTEQPAALLLELQLGGERRRFELCGASGLDRSCFRGARLALWHKGKLPAAANVEVARLGDQLARADRGTELHPDVELVLNWLEGCGSGSPVNEQVSPRCLAGPEASPVRRMLREHARHFGHAPRLIRRTDHNGERPVTCLEFTDASVPPNVRFVLPESIASDSISVQFLRTLGFDWNVDRVLRTVPLPSDFRLTLAREGIIEAGFWPFIHTTSSKHDLERLVHRARAVLAIGLPSGWYYASRRPLVATGLGGHRERWESQFWSLLRDLGKQLLPTLLVPRAFLRRIGRRAETALADTAGYDRKALLESLVSFYESDVAQHCSALCGSISGLDQFPAAFAARDSLAELTDRLRFRIEGQRGQP